MVLEAVEREEKMMKNLKKYFLGWGLIIFIGIVINYSIYVIGLIGLWLQMLYCRPISMLKEPYFVYDPSVGYMPTIKAIILVTIVYSLIYWICIIILELIKNILLKKEA
jgi:hypothetical protein